MSLHSDLTTAGIDSSFPGPAVAAGLNTSSRNTRIIVHPQGVAYPTTPDQVAKAVAIGAKYKQRVVALSGGHGPIGNGVGGSSGALVIDLGKLKNIAYDASTRRVTVQTGNTLKELHDVLQQNQRAITIGSCFTIGVGGHPASGGFGFAVRMWGLNCDAVQSINLVTDDGTQKTASANENPDLFWAMRGAAPSFAIATSVTYDTYPAPPSAIDFKYARVMPYQQAASAVLQFQQVVQTDAVPKEVGLQFRVDKGTDITQVALSVRGTYYGSKPQFDQYIDPLFKQILGITQTQTQNVQDNTASPTPFPQPDPGTFFTDGFAAQIDGTYYSSNTRGAADPSLTGDTAHLVRSIGNLGGSAIGAVGGVASAAAQGISNPFSIPSNIGGFFGSIVKGATDVTSSGFDVLESGANLALDTGKTLLGIGLSPLGYLQKIISPAPVDPSAADPAITFYMKSLLAPALTETALIAFMKYAAEKGINQIDWYVAFKLLGGKTSVLANLQPNAFAWRNSLWLIEFNGDVLTDPPPPFPNSGYTFMDEIHDTVVNSMPDVNFGAYTGFMDDRLPNGIQHYYGDNLPRLQQIKAAYAPNNVFVFPQSI